MVVGLLLAFGTGLLARIPTAALAGVLFFVAQRIFRVSVFVKVWRESRGEFALIIATMAAIVMLPIQVGVAIGIILSLLHGLWTITRARPIEFERVKGTTVWWPGQSEHQGRDAAGHPRAGVPGAAGVPERGTISSTRRHRGHRRARPTWKLVVLEASSVVEIDFTAAQGAWPLSSSIAPSAASTSHSRASNPPARRKRSSASASSRSCATDHLFHSVEEAIVARLGPQKPH